MMTSNQIAANQLRETERANRAKERENARSNRATERELNRSNVAKETETAAHNRVEEVTNRSKALNNPFSLISYGANNSQNAVEGIVNLLDNLGLASSSSLEGAINKIVGGQGAPSTNASKYLR